MSSVRTLPLFDPSAQPSTWNERMAEGEFAAHESSSKSSFPACTVLPSLAAAEDFAQQRVVEDPAIRVRIYDHQGFVGAPLREYTGGQFRGERDFSPKVRRWLGASFLLVGTTMVLVDWSTNFRLTWPALIGSRLLIPGALLFLTEFLILLQQRYGARFAARTTQSSVSTQSAKVKA